MTERAATTPMAAEETPRPRVPWMRGLRPRLMASYVVPLVLVSGVTVLVTRQLLTSRQARDVDVALAQEIEKIPSAHQREQPGNRHTLRR